MGLKRKGLISLLVMLLILFGIKVKLLKAMETEECLGCHGDTSIIEEGGENLYIDATKFSKTAHAEEGCASCHSVTDEHPDDGVPPTTESCDTCHEDINDEYGSSPHAENAGCTDCHNPHYVRNFAALSGFDQNQICATCHEGIDHSAWLPRSSLHMLAISCISCHTDVSQCVVTFFIAKKVPTRGETPLVTFASYKDLVHFVGKNDIKSLIDTNKDGVISLDELRKFNSNPQYKNFRLWGMMIPESVSHKFGIFKDRKDCSFCHVSGSKSLQTAYVAFPNEDGSYTRIPVKEGAVFDPLFATPDFYLVGAGKNNILSIIGIIMVIGGIGVVILHGTLRFLTRKNRRKH